MPSPSNPVSPDAFNPLTLERAMRFAAPGAPVPSPCVGVCKMDEASGLCNGCLRTIDEIVAWGQSNDAARRRIWRSIEERQGLL